MVSALGNSKVSSFQTPFHRSRDDAASSASNGFQPDFADLLREYAKEKDLSSGRNLHAQLREAGLDRRTLLGNLLVQMYSRCGELELARQAFDRIREWNDYSWTIVTSAYVKAGEYRGAVELYHKMCLEGMEPDEFVFASVMNACASKRELLEQGRAIHQRILDTGFDRDLVLQNAVLNMYGKNGCLDEARAMLDGLKEKNSVSWNAMLSAYSLFGYHRKALDLFKRMILEGYKPDLISFATVLAVCSSVRELGEGRKIHSLVRQAGIQADTILQNTLVSLYASCGEVGEARTMFDLMENKSAVSWTVMVSAYVQQELDEEALELYNEMKIEPEAATVSSVLAACARLEALDQGRKIHAEFASTLAERMTPDSVLVVENALVNLYAKCGCVDEAEKTFDAMKFRDVVSWNTLIAGVLAAGRGGEALNYYRKMLLDGTHPVIATFCSVLGACSSVRSIPDGQAIHSRIVDTGFGSVPSLENALVNFYAKCNVMDRARSLLAGMNAKRELSTWNAMILALAEEESTKDDALRLYYEMNLLGVEPNKFTLTSVLGACSRLDQGKAIHRRIAAAGVESDPTVATCLLSMYVNLGDQSLDLARNYFHDLPTKEVFSWTVMIAACIERGFSDEALELFQAMDVAPDNVLFTTVLGACSSLEATKLLQAKMASFSTGYRGQQPDVVASTELLNALSKCGEVDDARQVFDAMRNKNIWSWTAMIVGYAQHARSDQALETFREMELEGIEVDEIAFTSILHACSHGGLVRVGREYFRSMVEDHGIAPSPEHYNVVMDMLARAGKISDAEEVAKFLPVKHITLMTLVSSSKLQGLETSSAAKKLFQADDSSGRDTAASYIALSNSFTTS